MLIGSLRNLTSSLRSVEAPKAKPALPEQASANARSASDRNTTPGVVFDLSDAAWQAAAALDSSVSPATATAQTNLLSFQPAAMGVAADSAAAAEPRQPIAETPDASAAPAATEQQGMTEAPASPAAPVMASATTAQQANRADASLAPTEAQADPDEEARARAHAIHAQGRDQLLSLVENLAKAKADVGAIPNVPGVAAAPDGKAASLAA